MSRDYNSYTQNSAGKSTILPSINGTGKML